MLLSCALMIFLTFRTFLLSFAVAAQDVDDFIFDEGTDIIAAWGKILAGIKVGWVFSEILADTGSHRKAQVGVDVDLADGASCCLTEHFFWDTDCVWHCAAVCVDDGDKCGNNGRCAVQNNRESRQTLADLI